MVAGNGNAATGSRTGWDRRKAKISDSPARGGEAAGTAPRRRSPAEGATDPNGTAKARIRHMCAARAGR